MLVTGKFLRQTKALNDHLGKLAYEVEQISRIEEKHAIFLLKIDSIKDVRPSCPC